MANSETAGDSRQDMIDHINAEICKAYEYGKKNGLTEKEIDRLFKKAFSGPSRDHREHAEVEKSYSSSWLCFFMKLFFRCLLLCLLSSVIVFCVISHKPTQKFVTRHAQGYVYPVMRYLRLITLPVLQKYQFLTELHEEECLFRNPFYNTAIDCWPCEDLRTVFDLTSHANLTSTYLDRDLPFITQHETGEKAAKPVTFKVLKQVYIDNKNALEQGTASISSSDGLLNSLSQLFSLEDVPSRTRVVWKMKRVSAVQVIRTVFHRPYFVPSNVEVALQRFLFIDGDKFASYSFPITDFANVWIAQSCGYRQVTLTPSKACQEKCHTLSILLKPGDILYYNWQFYNARTSAAQISDQPSIAFLGSFY